MKTTGTVTTRVLRMAGVAVLLLILAVAGVPLEDAGAAPTRRAAPRRNGVQISRAPDAAPDSPYTAAVLMDARTGRVLYAHEPHLPWAPASTTKILTALIAMERLPLDTVVTISQRAARRRIGSAIGLEEGERWSLRSLLYAMMLLSANDAAVAVAEAAAGTVENFAAQMNARARQLGARNSYFVVPDGLHHPEHKSTAYDLALLARAAMMNPEFAKIVGTSTWAWEHPTDTRVLVNRNRLLWQFPGADGVKTGWTSQSGRSLVASATRDGWRLISVVLNAPMMFTESMRLLNHGFDSFASLKVAPRGAVLARAHVGEQELRAIVLADVYAVVPKGRTVTSRVTLRRDLTLPIARGSNVGEAVFLNAGAEVARAPLVAAGDIYPPSMAARIRRWLRSWQLWWR